MIDPEELRRLAQGAPEHRVRQSESETERRLQFFFAKKWVEARQVVADLEKTAREAANEGRHEAVIYEVSSYEVGILAGYGPPYSPVVERIEEVTKRGWFKTEKREEAVIRYIPAYAQYVVDSCPSDLSPRWEAVYYTHNPSGTLNNGNGNFSGGD